MDGETIFSKIIRGEIPADKVYETESVLAFKDIDPKAPHHILVIPKKRIINLGYAEDSDKELLGELLLAVRDIARELKLDESGFRVVINNGSAASQTVFHLHLHILGGREFSWPPG